MKPGPYAILVTQFTASNGMLTNPQGCFLWIAEINLEINGRFETWQGEDSNGKFVLKGSLTYDDLRISKEYFGAPDNPIVFKFSITTSQQDESFRAGGEGSYKYEEERIPHKMKAKFPPNIGGAICVLIPKSLANINAIISNRH